MSMKLKKTDSDPLGCVSGCAGCSILIPVVSFLLIYASYIALSEGVIKEYVLGTRIGIVTKLDHVTDMKDGAHLEGEMILERPIVVSIAPPEKFEFDANPKLAKKLDEAMHSGAKVELTYHKWLIKPWNAGHRCVVDEVTEAK